MQQVADWLQKLGLSQYAQPFAENDINLVKLESRPIHGKPWEYMFYVDIEADIGAAELKPVLEALEKKTDYLKILGRF